MSYDEYTQTLVIGHPENGVSLGQLIYKQSNPNLTLEMDWTQIWF